MGLLTQFSSKAELHRLETIKRFDDFVESYLERIERIEEPSIEELKITIVSRSPDSAVASALLRHNDRLSMADCQIRAIFSNVEPAVDFNEFAELARSCNGADGLASSVRWARNPALLDAHEQLVLGTSHCWSGDAMRRSSEVRFALDLFDIGGAATTDLGRMAFEGLWTACARVPKARLRNANANKTEPVVVQFDKLRDGLQDISFSASAVTRH
jgi:hypothetical protein